MMPSLPVNVPVILWHEIDVMKDKALVVVLLQGFRRTHVEEHCPVKGIVRSVLLHHIDTIV